MSRVLLFVTDLERGGTPHVVRELATRLPALGVETSVACLGRFGPVAEEIRDAGVQVDAFGCSSSQIRRGVALLCARRRDAGATCVLSFLVHANVIAALARRIGDGVRYLQSVQTTQPRPRWHWLAQRWAARHADAFVVPSQGVADAASVRSGIGRERIHLIPNGVDAADVVDRPRPPRDAASPLRVVFLGRLDPVKRVPLLARVVAGLPGVTLDVFGDGPDRANIPASPDVRLHGWTPPATALARADVLVLPSAAEGFGLVLIEAMAAGVPVIASDIPGIRDVVRHGETGLLFTPDTLRLTLELVRDDPSSAHTRAARALSDVRERFTWQAVVPEYARLILPPHPTR